MTGKGGRGGVDRSDPDAEASDTLERFMIGVDLRCVWSRRVVISRVIRSRGL